MKAVIYARYSSHNQREESIEGQLRECHEFATKNEMIVVDEYIDRALSGKTDNRPSFQKLIKDSERKSFDAVIMYTLDRFARNRYDSAIYKAKLKKNGVKIFYAKQHISDDPEGIILESVLEGYAEYYSANLARGIKRGMKESAMKALPLGAACLGYKIGSNREFIVDPLGAEAVRIIFQMYSEGKSGREITDFLNSRGLKTARGKPFNSNSYHRILENKKYIGTYVYDDVVIENAVPPIIDRELFDTVQEIIKKNTKSRARNKSTENYLLSTKLFCGHCGAPMIAESGKSKTGKIHRYYKCSTRKRFNKCDKLPERKESIEELVVKTTIEKVLTDENIKRIVDKTMELVIAERENNSILKSYEFQLQDVETRLKNVMAAIESGIVTVTTKNRLAELETERADLEYLIAKEEVSRPDITKDHISSWLRSFRTGDVSDERFRQRVIDTLVNSIFVYDNDGNGGKKYVIMFNMSGNNTATLTGSDIESLALPNAQNPNFFIIKHCFGFVLRI